MSGLEGERRWSGPLCGCGATQLTCECERDLNHAKCCWACEHLALPPDIRPGPTSREVKA